MQLVAAFSVIGFLTLVVSLLSWQAYRGAQEALISASTDAIGFIREAIAEKTRRIIDPAEEQLNFVAYSPLPQATDLPTRLQQVPMIAEALNRNPLIDAFYIGYANGEFILFRPLYSEAARQRFKAPDSASLLVQSISLNANQEMIGEYRFYDGENELISASVEPGYQYDPRTRPWYEKAKEQNGVIITPPYVFFTTEAVGLTIARRAMTGNAIIGLDAKLSSIASQLNDLRITPSSEIALINQSGELIAYRDINKMIVRKPGEKTRLATIGELDSPPLSRAAAMSMGGSTKEREAMTDHGRNWQVIQSRIEIQDGQQVTLLVAIPDDEFFASAREIVWRQALAAVLLLLLIIPLVWFATLKVMRPLRKLARETVKIESFDFTSDVKIRSRIREIDDLGRSLDRVKRTVRKFLKIGTALAAEQQIHPLLLRVLQEAVEIVHSDGGAIYLMDEEGRCLIPEVTRWNNGDTDENELAPQTIDLSAPGIFQYLAMALREKSIQTIEHHLDETELTALGLHNMVRSLNAHRVGLVIVPLLDRSQATLGVMLLVKAITSADGHWNVGERMTKLIHAVSGSASVAIQNKLLMESQRKLIDSLIKLVAGAIDAKSAYTGGHCQRVPVLTRMLATAACAEQSGPYKDFSLSQEEWEALDIAAWLHDCGKVTTPEFVIDKATKLETIYDRIHEIRCRFEILKRDAETAYWRGVAEGGDSDKLRQIMEAAHRELDEEFAFIAACNEGGEFMEPAKIERIKKIAARTWRRTLSNRLGLSYEEKARAERLPEPVLPVEEPLLADRYDHIVEQTERNIIAPDNPWGFKLSVPKYKYNRGEIYNLSINRGTLTEEERYCINDHIVQTIIMLQSLPFPKHLRNVPELAGGHHEKMDGTGYPKRLHGGEMSPVARMMAIADVFEALTAADRPYKKAKKLSEAIRIMGFMKKEHHLDGELLDLFLTSGIWRDYAQMFLHPDQIDEPDIDAALGIRPAA